MSIILAISFSALVSITGGSLVATEVIRAGSSLSETNTASEEGPLTEEERELFGREVVRTVYKGGAIKPSNTRTPRLVTRNQIVTVKYQIPGLEITLSGRAMGDGAVGEQVSIMNLESRQMMNGYIMPEGWVLVK